MNLLVRSCFIYPVKSCAAVPVNSLRFDDAGQIGGDREWVIVDDKGCMTWMGAIPRLALVRPSLTAAGWSLLAPDGAAVALPPAGEGPPCMIQAWNGNRGAFDSLVGRDAGDEAASFVAEVAGRKVRVVRPETRQHRPQPVHLTAIPSLRALAAEIGVGCDESFHRRFRPNVVLDAADGAGHAAFAEESAVSFTRPAGPPALTFEVTERCARCIMVNVDPDSAGLDGRIFVGTKRNSAARHPGEAAYFGLYARARAAGELAVGDTLVAALRG